MKNESENINAAGESSVSFKKVMRGLMGISIIIRLQLDNLTISQMIRMFEQ